MEEDIILFEWVFHYMSEKKHIWNWARMEFFNFNDISMKASIQEHKVLPDCAFGAFTFMYVGKIVWNILFRSLLNGNCIFSSASLSLLGQEIGAWTSSYCSF